MRKHIGASRESTRNRRRCIGSLNLETSFTAEVLMIALSLHFFRSAALLVLASCAVSSCNSRAQSQSQPVGDLIGVASVIDSDTIEIYGTRVRLSGFDAPEHGRTWSGVNVYQRASFALSDFIGARTVSCALTGAKTYEREVGTCSVDGRDIGELMVEAGWARDWPRYSHGKYADGGSTRASGEAQHLGEYVSGDLGHTRLLALNRIRR
jgi:endonuclease YncB( thermonuclease family)